MVRTLSGSKTVVRNKNFATANNRNKLGFVTATTRLPALLLKLICLTTSRLVFLVNLSSEQS